MARIKHTLAAFAFTLGAATAGAATVEVVFDVTAQSRTTAKIVGSRLVYQDDLAFSPVSFSVTARLDLDDIVSQNLKKDTTAYPKAWTTFGPDSVSITPTPLTAALRTPMPGNAHREVISGASIDKLLLQIPTDADQLLPERLSARFEIGEVLKAPVDEGVVQAVTHGYTRQINLHVPERQSPLNQLTRLSGDDMVAFLRSHIGEVDFDAFYEYGAYIRLTAPIGSVPRAVSHQSVRYLGDVVIRSVSVVPEPGTLVLALMGMAVVGWRMARRG